MVTHPGPRPLDLIAALIAALTRRRALVPILLLPAHFDMGPDDVATLIDSADDAGLVELWEDASGAPSVILSAAAAWRRGLELVTDALSRDNRFRWVKQHNIKPKKSQVLTESDHRDTETGWGGFDQIADCSYGVEMIVVDVLEDPELGPYLEKHGVDVATVYRRSPAGRGVGRQPRRCGTTRRYC